MQNEHIMQPIHARLQYAHAYDRLFGATTPSPFTTTLLKLKRRRNYRKSKCHRESRPSKSSLSQVQSGRVLCTSTCDIQFDLQAETDQKSTGTKKGVGTPAKKLEKERKRRQKLHQELKERLRTELKIETLSGWRGNPWLQGIMGGGFQRCSSGHLPIS